jgi:translation initiation factor IF-3
VIDDSGAQLGVMSLEEALEKAKSDGLELVEVSPNAAPPVCRIIDYGKFKYKQEKLAKDAKKKQRVIVVKEVRLRPRIEDHDYQVKMRNVLRFLEHGDRVKVSVMFRGREMGHQALGRQLLDRVTMDIAHIGEVEKLSAMEGRNLVVFVVPLKKGSLSHAKD